MQTFRERMTEKWMTATWKIKVLPKKRAGKREQKKEKNNRKRQGKIKSWRRTDSCRRKKWKIRNQDKICKKWREMWER